MQMTYTRSLPLTVSARDEALSVITTAFQPGTTIFLSDLNITILPKDGADYLIAVPLALRDWMRHSDWDADFCEDLSFVLEGVRRCDVRPLEVTK